MKTTRCSVEGCERPGPFTRTLCSLHYQRARYRGEIENLPKLTPRERLLTGLRRVPGGCLEWTGSVNHKGYGQIRANRRAVATHRLAWELANGPIPDGIRVLHHCDNPPCCDTEHLFLGTDADNSADMVAKGRASGQRVIACPAGHPYDEKNTYLTKRGHRLCRACHNARTLADYYRRRRGVALNAV